MREQVACQRVSVDAGTVSLTPRRPRWRAPVNLTMPRVRRSTVEALKRRSTPRLIRTPRLDTATIAIGGDTVRRGERVENHQWIGAALLAVAVGLAVVSSCGKGGGDGSSNGELCDQCGDTDGPCLGSVQVTGADADALCPALGKSPPCDVTLACLRKLNSAQRRCFPEDSTLDFFECDGSRANRRTATPTSTATMTPTGTLSPTPTVTVTSTGLTPSPALTPTPTPTSSPASDLCGNGRIDPGEQCDGSRPTA